jgi:hypothetical protein
MKPSIGISPKHTVPSEWLAGSALAPAPYTCSIFKSPLGPPCIIYGSRISKTVCNRLLIRMRKLVLNARVGERRCENARAWACMREEDSKYVGFFTYCWRRGGACA